MRSIATYFAERFPLVTVVPVVAATAIVLLGFASLSPLGPIQTVFVAIAFLCFLLRQRVTDEFKDSSHDDANYPNRPVQRGLISRQVLMAIGGIAVVIELGAVVSASVTGGSPTTAMWYLPFLAWSALTSVEFFAHDWLNRHFTLYFVSHQLIFVWLGVWAVAITGGTWSPVTVGGVVAFVVLMAAVEVVRKFELRHAPDGSVVRDTYPAVWGVDATITVLCALFGVVGALSWWRDGSPWIAGITAVAVGLLAFGNRQERTVQGALALVLLGTSLAVVLR